jgi:hypothetical protein
MKILRNYLDNNIVINNEADFHTDAGWEENLADFEKEVLYDIINPIENFETVRYIHQSYNGLTGIEQTDLWYNFYFLTTGITKEYVQDYTATGITLEENIKHLAQFYRSFFRLEFFKTPHILDVSGNTIGYQPPTRINRKMVFAKNLPVTTSMRYFYLNQNETIHVPVFFGSNYVNKENMYQFWFQDETVLNETNLSGTTTGNTFFMTAKFYNTKDGSIIDFTNEEFCSTHEITEQNDMYFQVDFNKVDHSYQIFSYNGIKGSRVGKSGNPVIFYEKGGKTNCQ